MTTLYHLQLLSAKFGTVRMEYPTEEKAKEAFARLKESARVWGEADGVERTVSYIGPVYAGVQTWSTGYLAGVEADKLVLDDPEPVEEPDKCRSCGEVIGPDQTRLDDLCIDCAYNDAQAEYDRDKESEPTS